MKCTTCAQPFTVHDDADDDICARCALIGVLRRAIAEALKPHEPYTFEGDEGSPTVGCPCEEWVSPGPSHLAEFAADAALKVFEDDEFYEPVVSYLNGRWR